MDSSTFGMIANDVGITSAVIGVALQMGIFVPVTG